jgi:hypothetical protein
MTTIRLAAPLSILGAVGGQVDMMCDQTANSGRVEAGRGRLCCDHSQSPLKQVLKTTDAAIRWGWISTLTIWHGSTRQGTPPAVPDN